jgi:hypothetical protein
MDWLQIISISSGIISLFTAIAALLLSYRVYRSQKSLENENQFFEHKMTQLPVDHSKCHAPLRSLLRFVPGSKRADAGATASIYA